MKVLLFLKAIELVMAVRQPECLRGMMRLMDQMHWQSHLQRGQSQQQAML
jgi:hypothetical protein